MNRMQYINVATIGLINRIIALKCGFILSDMSRKNAISTEDVIMVVNYGKIPDGYNTCGDAYSCKALQYLDNIM